MKILSFKDVLMSPDGEIRDLEPIDSIIRDTERYNPDKRCATRQFNSYTFGNKEECKKLFIEVFLKTDLTIINFEYLSEYDEIIEWMTNTNGKGLALFGSVGRGKTNMLTYVLPIIFRQHFKRIVRTKLATEIKREEILNTRKWAISIDDIGTENIKNDFGTKTDIVAEAINHAEQYSKVLFLTGNLTEKEIINRYGLRTFDRIKRLCKIVIFTGKSLRN